MRSNSPRLQTSQDLAAELLIAVSRLRNSKPKKIRSNSSDLSGTQLLLLRRIEKEGQTTASSLAASENVSHQAITQTLVALRREGLIESGNDSNDERKSPVRITDAGRKAIHTFLDLHTQWLVQRIESRLAPNEWPKLKGAIQVLECLARSGTLEDEASK